MRNDALILDAATELLSEAGWGGFALATVAPRAGLSKRPIIDRFPDRQALAVAVWRERVAPVLVPALHRVLDARTRLSADDLEIALEPFREPSSAMFAASELLVVRGYESRVRRAVDATLRPIFEMWTSPQPGRITRAEAARNAFLLAMAFGLLQAAPGVTGHAPQLSTEIKVLAEALARPDKPLKLPSDTASHLEAGFVFNVDDPVLQRVLQVVLEEVGDVGFDGATMLRITRASGVSEGYIFGRYKTKMDLFLDASDRSLGNNVRLNHEFMQRLDELGPPGIGSAVGMREFMAPGRELLRSIQLEQQRLTRHSPALREAAARRFEEFLDLVGGAESRVGADTIHAARFHFSMSTGTGTNLLAQLRPQAWDLPYDVVWIPLESMF